MGYEVHQKENGICRLYSNNSDRYISTEITKEDVLLHEILNPIQLAIETLMSKEDFDYNVMRTKHWIEKSKIVTSWEPGIGAPNFDGHKTPEEKADADLLVQQEKELLMFLAQNWGTIKSIEEIPKPVCP